LKPPLADVAGRRCVQRLALALLLVLLASHPPAVYAQERPLIGAQVWIEPGQKPADVESWFKTLADARMPVARLFLMWNYIETAPGVWDFRLYDEAFRAAEKYHVRVVATLTPNWGPPHRGYLYSSQGGAITDTEARLDGARDYIARVVARYKDSPALDTWMLMNEPGQRPAPDPLALQSYRTWLAQKYGSIARLNAAWLTDFDSFERVAYDPRWSAGGFAFTAPTAFTDWYTFWRAHLAWYLAWVAAEVRKVDSKHHLHVNPHALVGNLADNSFDLPSWRASLDSLGSSVHPAWHFGLLRREQFALGVGYVCDLVRGAGEPHPFWVTELQGGDNLYSSARPLSPTREDIAQWVWTGVGAGADRVIFWLLNARAQGSEAGEWSLLDFQGRASERFDAASEIAAVLERHADFFAKAKPVEAPVTVILSLETMTLQERYRAEDSPARDRNAHVLEALGLYQSLSELGVGVRLKQIDDFDWRGTSRGPRLAILPHVSALTAEQARDIEAFVRAGNTVLLTGLTGLYDEEARFSPLARWPLSDVLGGRLKEVRTLNDGAAVVLSRPALTLPSGLWVGEIANESAEVVGRQDGRVTAVRKQTGRGEAVWIPSLIGLGAWLGDGTPLSRLLQDLTEPFTRDLPFRFDDRQPGCLMRVLRSGESFVTVVTNGTAEARQCRVRHPPGPRPQALWGDASALAADGQTISLGARQTSVLLWR
jgi:beta-galactosidase